MDDNKHEEYIEFNNIMLPFGMARAKGPIEDFEITIYDKSGRPYNYRVVGGNILRCNAMQDNKVFGYEVK